MQVSHHQGAGPTFTQDAHMQVSHHEGVDYSNIRNRLHTGTLYDFTFFGYTCPILASCILTAVFARVPVPRHVRPPHVKSGAPAWGLAGISTGHRLSSACPPTIAVLYTDRHV
jgi:hypothetical protein